jgi:hypothetical protein
MGRFLRLINGVPRSFDEANTVPIYDQSLTLVSGAPANGNQITGPITTGTNVTLPGGQTYNSTNLEIYLNGDRLEAVFDYNYVGSVPRTQVAFTFDLVVGDRLDFRVDRSQ